MTVKLHTLTHTHYLNAVAKAVYKKSATTMIHS